MMTATTKEQQQNKTTKLILMSEYNDDDNKNRKMGNPVGSMVGHRPYQHWFWTDTSRYWFQYGL